MEAIRPLLRRVPAADDHRRPFASDMLGKRSLYFTISAIQSRFDLEQPDRLELEYTRLMAGFLLVQPAPRAIAMVGLGGGSLGRFCRRVVPHAHIAIAEINPHVIALRESFGVPPDDERFVVVPADGAEFVQRLDGRADVLLVDGYTAEGLPRQLSSQAFFDDCAAALTPGGVLVANVFADDRRRAQVEERIRRSFASLAWVVRDADSVNRIVFAVRAPDAGDALCHPTGVRLAPLRRPPTVTPAEWRVLQGPLARVLGAWKETFS